VLPIHTTSMKTHRSPPCLSLCLALAAQAELRTWKDASGAHEIKAELVSVQAGKVTLKRENGTTDHPARRQPQQGGSGRSRQWVAAAAAVPQPEAATGHSGAARTAMTSRKETGLLKKWPSGGPKRVWVNEDAGLGYSGFSVVGGKLYTMGLYDAEEKAHLPRHRHRQERFGRSPVGAIYKNGWGDGPRTHAHRRRRQGVCHRRQWRPRLRRCRERQEGLDREPHRRTSAASLQNWGYTESPLVDGDLVIVTPGGRRAPSPRLMPRPAR
jgi:hypothetical protein